MEKMSIQMFKTAVILSQTTCDMPNPVFGYNYGYYSAIKSFVYFVAECIQFSKKKIKKSRKYLIG